MQYITDGIAGVLLPKQYSSSFVFLHPRLFLKLKLIVMVSVLDAIYI